MIEKQKNDFQDWYNRAFEESRNYTNPNPIMEFAGEVSLYGKDAMPFLRRIEQDLLDRNIVDNKILCWDDFLQSTTKYTYARKIQFYIGKILELYGE